MEAGITLQRLFSAFPDGWPGWGLVLLRVTISLPLFYWAIRDQAVHADAITLTRDWLGAAGGLFLIAGLWTPFAGVLIALVEVWTALSERFALQGHILVAALGLSLAMLGPGAWSADARLFGRKVFKSGDADI